jgi:CBS domain-containing protein
MTTVRQVLAQKDPQIWSIDASASVFEAIAMMAEKDIGSLLVTNGGKLIGIITERHYSRDVALKGKSSLTIPVTEIMERSAICVGPDTSVEECMALMTEKRVRHLPVVDRGDMVGIVSIGDLVKSVISEQKFIIDQLEHYIHGEASL